VRHRRDRGADGRGPATIFILVDDYTAECVGIHAARRGTRFEALEPLRQGIQTHFGAYGEGVAAGLALRHDYGSQFMSEAFQAELRFLGIASSPAFVREPEGNGCAERFTRTLKEQVLWVEHFATVEDLRRALLAFQERYSRGARDMWDSLRRLGPNKGALKL
jgi:putative transposase